MASETYMHVMRMFYKIKHTYEEPHVSINNYSDQFTGPGPSHPQVNIKPGDLPVPTIANNWHYPPEIEKICSPQINIFPLDLERSTVQDLSGLPLNNSRVLNFQWKQIPGTDLLKDIGQNRPVTVPPHAPQHVLDGATLANSNFHELTYEQFGTDSSKSTGWSNDTFDVNLFMQYLKVARVFIDNIQVEE
jgi:hypothetical protein